MNMKIGTWTKKKVILEAFKDVLGLFCIFGILTVLYFLDYLNY